MDSVHVMRRPSGWHASDHIALCHRPLTRNELGSLDRSNLFFLDVRRRCRRAVRHVVVSRSIN